MHIISGLGNCEWSKRWRGQGALLDSIIAHVSANQIQEPESCIKIKKKIKMSIYENILIIVYLINITYLFYLNLCNIGCSSYKIIICWSIMTFIKIWIDS